MDVEALRRLALELLRRQPAAFADLVNDELPAQGQLPLQERQDEDVLAIQTRYPSPNGIYAGFRPARLSLEYC